MSNQATAKGSLLAIGITTMGAGSSLLLTEKWAIGLLLEIVGAAFIYFREYLKTSRNDRKRDDRYIQ